MITGVACVDFQAVGEVPKNGEALIVESVVPTAATAPLDIST